MAINFEKNSDVDAKLRKARQLAESHSRVFKKDYFEVMKADLVGDCTFLGLSTPDIEQLLELTQENNNDIKKYLLDRWLRKGKILYNVGKNREALECFYHALEIEGNDYTIWWHMGKCLKTKIMWEGRNSGLQFFKTAIDLMKRNNINDHELIHEYNGLENTLTNIEKQIDLTRRDIENMNRFRYMLLSNPGHFYYTPTYYNPRYSGSNVFEEMSKRSIANLKRSI